MMVSCAIIELQAEGETGKPAFGLLNWKLNDELLAAACGAVLTLPPRLLCDLPLLDFLAEWNARFTASGKKLVIIPGDIDQKECLALSHPDLALHTAASMAEVKRTRPELFDTMAHDKSASETLPAPASGEPQTGASPAASVLTMAVGDMVTTSGEYGCAACGNSRMWLKGDLSTACGNLECSNPHAGWQLTFELF